MFSGSESGGGQEQHREILVLDGGFSNEVNKYCSFDVNQEALWTAKALYSEPQPVVTTHLAYLTAGADIISTSTYQATVEGFKTHLNLDYEKGEELIKGAVGLAKEAVDKFVESESSRGRKKPLIAGSVGPYGAFLCDGSEYTGDYMKTVSDSDLIEMHLPRLRALIQGGVDILAIETIPALAEAKIILDLLVQHFPDTKAWVSFSLRLNENKNPLQTAFGDSVKTAFDTLSKYSQVVGFGLNCCAPTDITPFLNEIAPARDKHFEQGNERIKLVVYPNSGQKWIHGTGWINDPVPSIVSYVQEWIDNGADYIGGCCQIGPSGISEIRPVIDNWNSGQTKPKYNLNPTTGRLIN